MKKILYWLNLQLFAEAGTLTNTTTGTVNAYTGAATTSDAMSVELKTYYDTAVLENSREKRIFFQLGMKQRLPKRHGKSVELRKFDKLPEAEKLQEAVIPEGAVLRASAINIPIDQYGRYVTISDILDMRAIDPVALHAAEEVSWAGQLKYEKLIRAVLQGTANVLFADALTVEGDYVSTPTTRAELAQAASNVAYLTPRMINKAVTILKKANAPAYQGGKYLAVIHPSVAEDLRNSKGWLDAHQYAKPDEIYNGEIGELHGVRFIESTLAPIVMQGDVAVYQTFFFGRDAFAVIDPEGGGMETIIKSRDQVGGPLNQFSTVGVKFEMGAGIVYPERMLALESLSSYSDLDQAN